MNLTVEEAAAQVGISEQWMRKLCASGSIHAVKKAGVWTIHPRTLAAWQRRHPLVAHRRHLVADGSQVPA